MVETEREIMETEKRWLGHSLRHDSLLRTTLEGQIQRKKAYGRPRTMLLDWLLKTGRQYQLRRTKDVCPGQI